MPSTDAAESQPNKTGSHTTAPGFFERVYQVVRMIPPGRVATYGQIAAIVSHRGAARTVGWALHSLTKGSDVPWHRVINSRGWISLHPGSRQTALLRNEGIAVDRGGKIDMRRFQWPGLDWPEVEALRSSWHTQSEQLTAGDAE
jgi:methylated-DNA-protein-cysteine methyltransferase-like protein